MLLTTGGGSSDTTRPNTTVVAACDCVLCTQLPPTEDSNTTPLVPTPKIRPPGVTERFVTAGEDACCQVFCAAATMGLTVFAVSVRKLFQSRICASGSQIWPSLRTAVSQSQSRSKVDMA